MKVRLWGTRGSIPRAIGHDSLCDTMSRILRKAKSQGLATVDQLLAAIADGSLGKPLILGGDTSCYEFDCGSKSAYVDMGTGIIQALNREFHQGIRNFAVFQTHVHWDHIMGMPYLLPIYSKGCKLTIYHVHRHAPQFIKSQFNGVNFPVPWREVAPNVEFVPIAPYAPLTFGDAIVTPFTLDHPGDCYGYRFDHRDGTSVAIGVDGEYKRFSREELGKDLPFYQNLDLLVFDGQYDADELEKRFDWGHCTPQKGAALAVREGIRHLVLAHHDPETSEEKAFAMLKDAEKYIASLMPEHRESWSHQPQGPIVHMAYDGALIDVSELNEAASPTDDDHAVAEPQRRKA